MLIKYIRDWGHKINKKDAGGQLLYPQLRNWRMYWYCIKMVRCLL